MGWDRSCLFTGHSRRSQRVDHLYQLHERVESHGLREDDVCPGVQELGDVILHHVAGHPRDEEGIALLAHVSGGGDAVHHGHEVVHEHQLVAVRGTGESCRGSVLREGGCC